MADEDKLMGLRDGKRVYAAYRIDYDSSNDIRDDVDLSGSAKSPRPGHDGHTVKDGYQRKIVVEDATTRDEVQSHLNSEGISHTTEDVSPTQSEMDCMERWGAKHGLDAKEAIAWDNAVASASTVADLKDVQRGQHPETGEKVEPPKKPQHGQ